MIKRLKENEVIDIFINNTFKSHSEINPPWVILYQGKPLKMRSGKSSWQKKNHATAALSNHLYGKFNKYTSGWSPGEVTKLLQEKGIIEVKQLFV